MDFAQKIKGFIKLITPAKFHKRSYESFVELIVIKALFNLRSEVHKNYLSYLWWIVEPLLHMSVYYLVFGFLLKRGGPNFPMFLLVGLVPWMWFRKTISSSSNSIIGGERLMLQVRMPVISFPLIKIFQTAIKQIPVFLMLIMFLVCTGNYPNICWIAIVPLLFVQALLSTAIACLVALVIPFIRDISYLVETGLMFLMFVSGIFYDYQNIPVEYHKFFLMNPMAYLIANYRAVFLESSFPDMLTLSGWGVISVICCSIVAWLYVKTQYIVPRAILK